jgi:hypothetical protein
MTQLNVPYPSTAYLTGFLRSRGIDAVQEDLALALVLKLFSPDGLRAMRECVVALPRKRRTTTTDFYEREFDRYLATVDAAVAFLQGRDPSRAHRIAGRNFLPEGPRFAALDVYVDGRAAIRSPGPSARSAAMIAPGISLPSISTISPTCFATPSTSASSSSVTPNRWRKASQASTRWRRRWPRRPISSTVP